MVYTLNPQEEDPSQPKLFEYKFVNLYNPDDALTLNPFKKVPAGKYKGQNYFESIPFSFFVDEEFAGSGNALQPNDPSSRFRMNVLIQKHYIAGPMFGLLRAQTPEQLETAKGPFISALSAVGADVQGPYLLGDQFTLADIIYLPFVEIALTAVVPIRGIELPNTEELNKLKEWFAACIARPSYKVLAAPRTGVQHATYPFESINRADYLREVLEVFSLGGSENEMKAIFKNAPGGKRLYTREQLIQKISELKPAVECKMVVLAHFPPQPSTILTIPFHPHSHHQ